MVVTVDNKKQSKGEVVKRWGHGNLEMTLTCEG